jgi:hypothetical protein
MTSISAATSSTLSPLQKLQDQLQAEVNSGAISSSDQSALSSALTDINASLQNGAAGDQSGGTSSPPSDLKSKIEVSSGKLTSDQASELQGVFKAAFADAAGAAGGAGHAHHGHHGGHGGASSADSSQATDSTSSTSSADVLQQFLQSLQNSLTASSSSASYGATGATDPASSAGTSFSALLINYQSCTQAGARRSRDVRHHHPACG